MVSPFNIQLSLLGKLSTLNIGKENSEWNYTINKIGQTVTYIQHIRNIYFSQQFMKPLKQTIFYKRQRVLASIKDPNNFYDWWKHSWLKPEIQS